MIKSLETESEKQPNRLKNLVPLDFIIKLFEARMRYSTPEIMAARVEANETRRKYQGARMRYLIGVI